MLDIKLDLNQVKATAGHVPSEMIEHASFEFLDNILFVWRPWWESKLSAMFDFYLLSLKKTKTN